MLLQNLCVFIWVRNCTYHRALYSMLLVIPSYPVKPEMFTAGISSSFVCGRGWRRVSLAPLSKKLVLQNCKVVKAFKDYWLQGVFMRSPLEFVLLSSNDFPTKSTVTNLNFYFLWLAEKFVLQQRLSHLGKLEKKENRQGKCTLTLPDFLFSVF